MDLILILLSVFAAYTIAIQLYRKFYPTMVSKEVITKVQQAIKANQIFVASKTFCPYCQQTLATFDQLGVKPLVFQLNQMPDGAEIQAYLKELTGQSTVPNVFINGEHIGGNSDLQVLKSTDKLEKLLKL